MRITKEQETILNNLVCERLSSNAVNEELIKSFESKRGSSLVSYFQQLGLKEDAEGSTDYYVIKTKDDLILMFFSLKCGALYEPFMDENEIRQDFQRLLILIQAIDNANGNYDEIEEISRYKLQNSLQV